MCQRVNVVERRRVEIERGAAIDTALAAVAHSGALDRTLVSSSTELADSGAADATREAGEAGEASETGKHDAVTVSTNGHFTSLEKATPCDGTDSQRKVSEGCWISATARTPRSWARLSLKRKSRCCRTRVGASEAGRVAFRAYGCDAEPARARLFFATRRRVKLGFVTVGCLPR
jgi:hypothetical protein